MLGLQVPVLGYCEGSESVFIGEHFVESACAGHCHHDEVPEPVPCEEEHEFLTVEMSEFQWEQLTTVVPPVLTVIAPCEDIRLVSLEQSVPLNLVVPEHDPPPPEASIFLRDEVWRL